MTSTIKKIAICTLQELQIAKSLGWCGLVNDNERQYFLVYQNDVVYSYQNQCPHTGVNLEWVENQFLDNDHEFIQCATHGALFRIENGLCVYGPCAGENLKPIKNMTVNDTIYLVFPENG